MFQHPSDKNEYGFIYPLQKINVEQSEKGNLNRLLCFVEGPKFFVHDTTLYLFHDRGVGRTV